MIPKALFRLALLLAALTLAGCLSSPREAHIEPGQARVYFSPRGGAQQAVVEAIDQASKEILVQAYGFTNKEIIAALSRAAKAGIMVRIILDKSCAHDNDAAQAKAARAIGPTFIDSEHAIAHNKVMVIDQARVVTGSFNFTNAAEHANAENLLVVDSPELAAIYRDNFKAHLEHAKPFK